MAPELTLIASGNLILTKKAEKTSAFREFPTLFPTTIKACCILILSASRFKVKTT